ncbi:lipid phosphate phosphatase 1 [Auriculariales sp. MPI-PUGE-AT-0066]|nr:lipid phosphate phosphatase 1 [Auriculariales sp. MPI-PUGE-AT-0066]
MERIRATLRSELDWFDRAYIVDWTITAALFIAAQIINRLPVFQRDIVAILQDPDVAHSHGPAQVPGWLNDVFSFFFPLGVAVLNGIIHVSSHELHHGVLTCLSGWFLMDFVVNSIKNRVGRFRPDFLDRCRYDVTTKQCTGSGEAHLVFDGRRSFPSGHSSSAFVGLGFVSLLLLLKLNTHTSSPHGGLLQSKLARLVLVLSPLGMALWIALTRVEDNYHHPTDIITGSIIGILCALVTFHIYWPSPFSRRAYHEQGRQQPARVSVGPRLLYGRDDIVSREGFELANVNEHDERDYGDAHV